MKEESSSIKDFMAKTGTALVVRRIPKKALETFKKVAYEEFEGDYGMYIKFLQDFYLGLVPTGWEHLEAGLNNLNERLTALESKPVVKEEKEGIKMGNGRVIPRS